MAIFFIISAAQSGYISNSGAGARFMQMIQGVCRSSLGQVHYLNNSGSASQQVECAGRWYKVQAIGDIICGAGSGQSSLALPQLGLRAHKVQAIGSRNSNMIKALSPVLAGTAYCVTLLGQRVRLCGLQVMEHDFLVVALVDTYCYMEY